MFKVITILAIISTIGDSQVTNQCRSLNQNCGGAQELKCCLGQHLKCVYDNSVQPEATGVCQKTCNKEGQYCLGFSRDPQICCSGLTCIQTDARIPDMPGTCRNSTQ